MLRASLVLLLSAAALPAAAQVPIAGRIPDPPVTTAPGPTPRLPDGRPDFGNGKGAWNPRVVANLAGSGRSTRERSPVERVVDVPFQPWAKTVYEQRLKDLSFDDP